jgi:hypothetical protein
MHRSSFRKRTVNKTLIYQRIVLSMLALMLAFAGCDKKEKKPYAENKRVAKIKSWFANYDFQDATPKALDRLEKTAAKGKRLLAAEKLYLNGRVHLDWLLTALINNDSAMLRDLLARLKITADCCPQKKKCVRSRRLVLKARCREKLRRKLHVKFQALRDLESDDGDYAQLSKKAQKLLSSLLLQQSRKSKQYRKTLHVLSTAEDPIGNRASLLILAEAASNLSAVSLSPPSRAGFMMAFLAPYWCEEPIKRIRPNMSPHAIRNIVVSSVCGYKCNAVKALPKQTSATYKKVIKSCPFEFLGFDQKAERIYFTQQSFLALKTLRLLVRRTARLQKDRSDPLLKRHHKLLALLKRQLEKVRVALPYPPVMLTEKGFIEPPIVRAAQNMELYAPVHVVLGELNYFVGLLPHAGIEDGKEQMLDVENGYILPGKVQLIPKKVKGPLVSLQAMIKKARRAAAAVQPPRRVSAKYAAWISIYADRRTKLKKLHALLRQLAQVPNPKITAVQLVFVDNPVAGAASQGATLHIGAPPQKQKALALLSNEEIAAAQAADKKKAAAVQKNKPARAAARKTRKKKKSPTAFVLDKPRGTVDNLIRNIIEVRRKHGPAAVYWEIKP